MGVVVPFPVMENIQPEINPLQALRNLEFNMEDVYPVQIVHIVPEHIMPEKKQIDFDFHVTGRTELDLTGLKFVQENLERKKAIKRALDYLRSKIKHRKIIAQYKIKYWHDNESGVY